MPHPPLTLKEIADCIAELDNLDADAAKALHQSWRYIFQQFGVLVPTDSAGPRGAWRFGFTELCRARLLGVLLDMGFPRSDLVAVNAGLNDTYLGERPAGETVPTSCMGWAIRETVSGAARWILRVELWRTPAGTLAPLAVLLRASEDTTEFADLRHLLRTAEGDALNATITLPASDLLAPLVTRDA